MISFGRSCLTAADPDTTKIHHPGDATQPTSHDETIDTDQQQHGVFERHDVTSELEREQNESG